ncbi:hypothetical protein OOZ63_20330 [Paucibacter sp. PLA-PC-4]|uniref:hypothetical protein n=1 Tax=Paucibacter sp. PLA-PC-4 TaxID=2993655 RepID=UPI00224B7ACC|nr:hypothetical protein [Paucibacter sp. PLA-PC-4]MCX2864180.1 hypothetical protein [Paucibacter sp. PLA-PC-4]
MLVFFSQFAREWTLRRERFNREKTPKRFFSFWFFIVTLGQIGIITSLIWAGINGEGFMEALAKQGKSGNFLTFEISLILSCLAYYFEEYGEEPIRALFLLRITWLLLAMIVAFLAMLNYIYINSTTSPTSWPDWFVYYNTILYIAGVLLSYFMYITFSVVEPSVAEDMKSKTDAAISAANEMDSTIAASIGEKKINLEG